VTLSSLAAITVLGIWKGVGEGTPVGAIYDTVNSPLASTMFALLAFVIASAAFRAFRARSVEATLLLITAIVMMIGRVSIGPIISPHLPGITEWLLDVPNLAAKRAIALGVGLAPSPPRSRSSSHRAELPREILSHDLGEAAPGDRTGGSSSSWSLWAWSCRSFIRLNLPVTVRPG